MKKSFNFLFLIHIVAFTLLILNCQQPSAEVKKVTIINQEGFISMVEVPAMTSFSMGYAGVSTPVHIVPSISGFKIGKYEVTYEEWRIVRTWALANGYTFANLGREGNDGVVGANPTTARNEPVTQINWRDAIVWCNAASEYDGFTPVYYTNSGMTTVLKSSSNGIYGSSINTAAGSFDNPYVTWSANGYRLPTEAEWEAAARYQNGTIWTYGDYASGAADSYSEPTSTGNVAWYSVNSGAATHAAGIKNSNQLLVYDMTGNVWEWCWDWHGAYTNASPYTNNNPKGTATGTDRISRGGGYLDAALNMMVSFRGYLLPYSAIPDAGLRVARRN